MSPINPTGDQFNEFKSWGKQGTFVMVNLLKFKGTGRENNEKGKESYERYTQAVAPMLGRVGARLIWLGSVDQVFIGETGDEFDHVMLVEYPSRKAFLKMVSSREYQEANRDREAGLERAVLLAADPLFSRMGKAKE